MRTPTLAFILGREPHLSVAEIAAVFGDGADWAKAEVSAEALVVPVANTVDASALTSRLGGSVKIGEVWREVPHDGFDGDDEAIGKFILEHTDEARKVRFGYSVYDLGAGSARTAAIRKALARGAAAQKAWLGEHDRKVRWVTSREPALSSVVVAKNDLLPDCNGVEVLVLVASPYVILARTIAVQPFEEWGARDYGRPKRDARSGMLPPKLARIMLNIGISNFSSQGGSASGGKSQISNATVLDPFCGSGTVLTEAMQLGVSQIIGTDVSAEAIRDATANIAWVGERLATRHEVTITQCDVRQLSRCVRERVDAIVTEPYLGPAKPQGDSRELQAQLHELYVAAFREFVKVLRPGGRAVFIVPVFRTPRYLLAKRYHDADRAGAAVDIVSDVQRLGFRRIIPFPPALARHPIFSDAADLPYARLDQRIGRRIFVFERT